MDLVFQELTKAGISVAVKTLFERVVSRWDKTNLNARRLVRELTSQTAYMNYLQKHVSRVIRLRTIHSADYDILLNEMYHPLSICALTPGSTPKKVKDGFYFEDEFVTNIIGIAGQGKSTILRKLFIEQVFHGDKIPFFIELRKVGDDGIRSYLERLLKNLSLRPTDVETEELFKSNKIILMLDGFDEISSEKKNGILNEITQLNLTYSLQVITTSRPGTTICSEPSIVNYKVELLKESDILSIIERLNTNNNVIDKEQLSKIKETIRKNKNLVSVMTSPILVTLFHVCYPYMDIIPKNTVEFYSNLFMTLYLRHDKVKNFDREKSSSLSHNEAYECFCALCFYSIYKNSYDFTERSLIDYTKTAMQVKGKKEGCEPASLAMDFVNVTCLIQKDGYDKYIFIHKSIQEYHAAEFIKNISSEKKGKFYNLICEDIKNNNLKYSNSVAFLAEIDEIDCARHLIMPLCEHSGVSDWAKLDQLGYKELFRNFFSDCYANLEYDGNSFKMLSFSHSTYFNNWLIMFLNEEYNEIYSSSFDFVFRFLFENKLPE
ncbi:NACHT domain-containing protein, partial [Escherichia coli]|nr:NACHT domain-containing protein [Escherichia coli]